MGHSRDTNNNDNNIIFNLFNNNNIKGVAEKNWVPFKEGDEISQFLKTKGIKNIDEYKNLDEDIQNDLLEEWLFNKT